MPSAVAWRRGSAAVSRGCEPANIAVLGLFFGDEGKGRTVDYFASRLSGPAWVVRHNGGAQAGHTVRLDDGHRHVFHHHGSGTFAGLPTFLSRFFVVHPMLFCREHEALRAFAPQIHVDRRCFVTTPYDMLLNEAREILRGEGRHGSVGVGFGETIRRNLEGVPLRFEDLARPSLLRTRLQAIREAALRELLALAPEAAAQLAAQCDLMASEGVFRRFLQDCEYLLEHSRAETPASLDSRRRFIFEGAQGLLLDEDFGCFPHVTRSRTGLRNALRVADELGIRIHHVYRVCRPYLTRHGRGPLPFECPRQTLGDRIVDDTNVSGEFQEHLRFAPFNFAMLETALRLDGWREIPSSLVLSCCDQMPESVLCAGEGPPRPLDFRQEFMPRLRRQYHARLFSWSAARSGMEDETGSAGSALTPPRPPCNHPPPVPRPHEA